MQHVESKRNWRHVAMGIVCLVIAGCSSQQPPPPEEESSGSYNYGTSTKDIKFHDTVEQNTDVISDLTELTLTNVEGQAITVKDHVGEKNLVIVVTRGYADQICPFCSTQVSRLISRYDEIKELESEVLVVFPVSVADEKGRLEEFLTDARDKLEDPSTSVPFPALLDVELGAVEKLGIREALSKPATYILDTKGKVRFAYVGKEAGDRPSLNAIIGQLKLLNES